MPPGAAQADGASYRNVLLRHGPGRLLRAGKHNPQHGTELGPRAGIVFGEPESENLLAMIRRPKTSPLSVLAVEILPGQLNLPDDLHRDADAAPDARDGNQREDPLGRDLGAGGFSTRHR